MPDNVDLWNELRHAQHEARDAERELAAARKRIAELESQLDAYQRGQRLIDSLPELERAEMWRDINKVVADTRELRAFRALFEWLTNPGVDREISHDGRGLYWACDADDQDVCGTDVVSLAANLGLLADEDCPESGRGGGDGG